MSIRFCEFCSTVHPDETTHCPICGARLVQTTSEEDFNNPSKPWPFVPITSMCLVIQGKPRQIIFSGTHSVYHLWAEMHRAYEAGTLYFREKGEELELISFPENIHPEDCRLLEPVSIMASNHSRFSLHTYVVCDPELEVYNHKLEKSYQGSFEIQDCPDRFRKDILGWLAATEPRPELDNQWTYFMT